MIDLIRTNSANKIVAVYTVNSLKDIQGDGTKNLDLIDVTDLSQDGESFMGRTYDPVNKSVSPFVSPSKTRRQELKEKQSWTVSERNEAIRMLL